MLPAHLIDILRCPQDRSRVRLANQSLIERINSDIAAGKLRNAAGESLNKMLDAGLVREAGDLLYPVIDQIPVMLPDEAIAIPPSLES